MTTLQQAVVTVLVRSLLRGKSLIQAILAYWISPLAADSKSKSTVRTRVTARHSKGIRDFLKDAEATLLGPVSGDGLLRLSAALKKQFYHRLQTDPECMLPSFSHQLPTGGESGQYLALDVGGSTLRVALVELRGRTSERGPRGEISSMRNFQIGRPIKDLEGMAFFDWMAGRIMEVVLEGLKRKHSPQHPVPLALAWSFPIEQTSLGGGKLQGMGKGFLAEVGLLGRDLGDLVQSACKKRGLNVELQAIINDSSACLLSQAYFHPSTRFGLVLGTGFNMSAYLPASSIGRSKFGTRPQAWFDMADHVIVNTELSMFGHDILPLTRWDRLLLKNHPRPGFQPLEHLVSGMYLGEICRHALVEAIETTGIFGGVIPPSLKIIYGLGTDTLSIIAADASPDLKEACKVFADRHPSSHSPTASDLAALKELASFISVRSSALVATSVFTLWDLRLEAQQTYRDSIAESSPLRSSAEADMRLEETVVSFNGSVIENYPGYLDNCKRYLNDLVESMRLPERGRVDLIPAKESSLLGAAVALACINGEA